MSHTVEVDRDFIEHVSGCTCIPGEACSECSATKRGYDE